MQINATTMKAATTGFKTLYDAGFGNAKTVYNEICMRAKSGGSEEVYAWLGQLPEVREWLGDRHIHRLKQQGFRIENKDFESTVVVKRNDLEDDKIGIYSPLFTELGRRAAEHPDKLLAELIAAGFDTPGYDGQNFFDADHPVSGPDGKISVSNFTAGAGPAWYLLDLSREIRPFIYQERGSFILESMDGPSDEPAFLRGEFHYGVRGRGNVGFGMWQLAHASKATLDGANYEAARIAMSKMRGDNNRLLGIRPTHLLVPAELEGKARRLLKNNLTETGGSNEWMDSAELIVSQWL